MLLYYQNVVLNIAIRFNANLFKGPLENTAACALRTEKRRSYYPDYRGPNPPASPLYYLTSGIAILALSK